MDTIPTSCDIPPEDPLHVISPETLKEERQTTTLHRSRGALRLSLPTEHELESLHESRDTTRSSSNVPEDPLHVISQKSTNEKVRVTTLSRSRGALHLPIQILSRWPFRNLEENDDEPLFPNAWQGRVSNAVRFLCQDDNTKATHDESNKLQPLLHSMKRSAEVVALAFPFRRRPPPEDGSMPGTTSATSLFMNPFRSMHRETPMEPAVTENASLRDLMGTAQAAASKHPVHPVWDFFAVLLSQLRGWFTQGFSVTLTLLSLTPLPAWWDQICRALSWPQELLAKFIWFLESVRNEALNVRKGTGRKKYVFAAGASIAINKASNIKVERPRLARRPKRHSTRNGDW